MVSYASETLKGLRDRRLAVWTELKRVIGDGKFSGGYYDALRDELQVLDASIASVLKVMAAGVTEVKMEYRAPTGVSEVKAEQWGGGGGGGRECAATHYNLAAPVSLSGAQLHVLQQLHRVPVPPPPPADPIFTEITGIDPPDTYDGWREAYIKTGLQSALDHMREHVR